MTLEVIRYDESREEAWNNALAQSKNGLFLFHRDFMNYHSDRFEDFSFLALREGKVRVLFPASIDRSTMQVTSHAGLTYGGFVIEKREPATTTIASVGAILDEMRSQSVARVTVRLVPDFLANYPSGDVEYALWRHGFQEVRKDLTSLLPLQDGIPPKSSKKQSAKKATRAGVQVSSGELSEFHALLSSVLKERHDSVPVHSREELAELMNRFPSEIFLRTAKLDGKIVAGALFFRFSTAWHTQYLANSDNGRSVGALDAVIMSAIAEARETGANLFSFGSSTTNAGWQLNEGLLWQKESFGARSQVLNFVALNL